MIKSIALEYGDLFAGAIFVALSDKIFIQNSAGEYIFTLPRSRGLLVAEKTDDFSLAFFVNGGYFVITDFPDEATRDADWLNLVNWSNTFAGGGGGGGAVTIADGDFDTFGFKADTAALTDTAVTSFMSLFKRLLTQISVLLGFAKNHGPVSQSVVSVTAVSAIHLAADPNRNSLMIWNNGTPVIHVSVGSPAAVNYGIRIPINSGYEFEYCPTDDIHIRTTSGSGKATLYYSS